MLNLVYNSVTVTRSRQS